MNANMKIIQVLLSAAAALMLAGCQSGSSTSAFGFGVGQSPKVFTGPMVTRTIDAKNFSEIRTQQSIVVNYTQSPVYSVSCTAPEDAWEYLSITAKGDKLDCGFGNISTSFRDNSKRVVVNVTGPMVTDFRASSSGVINVPALNADARDVDVDASSSGSVFIRSLNCRGIDIDVSSSACVAVQNIAAAEIEVDGSSSAVVTVSGNCATASFDFSSSATAKAEIAASGMVEAEASSSSTVELSGSARTVDLSASSSGSVLAERLKAQTGSIGATSAGLVKSNVSNLAKSHSSSGGTVRNTDR